jgi:hypothetical protein
MKKPKKTVKEISEKQNEMLTERFAEAGGVKPILDILVGNIEFSMFTMTEYRFWYHGGEGMAFFELRPVPTDISNALKGIEPGTIHEGRIDHFHLKDALKELEALDTLSIDHFDFWAADDENSAGDEGDRFVIEGMIRFQGEVCPISLSVYVDQPFEDAKPVEFDPNPE